MMHLSSLSTRFARFFARPFVSGALQVSSLPAFASNLTLFVRIHRSEAAILFWHGSPSLFHPL